MWFLGARIEISAEERLTACRAAFDVEIKCLQLHIYGQLSLKITGLACFGKEWIALLCKSWNFEEASLGVAALNAWYARPELLNPLGARYDEPIELSDSTTRKIDTFEMYCPRIGAHESARVTVVDHFPNVAKIGEYAKHFRIDFRFAIELRINLARLRIFSALSPIPPDRTSSSCRFPSWARQLKAAFLRGTSRPGLCRR